MYIQNIVTNEKCEFGMFNLHENFIGSYYHVKI